MQAAEELAAQLVRDYLDENRTVPPDPLPASADLPIVVGLGTDARVRPSVVVHVAASEYPHPKVCKAVLGVELLTQGDDTTAAEASAWISAIKALMTDSGTWTDWFSATPAADLEGWGLLKVRLLGSEIELAPDERGRSYRLPFAVHLRHYETELAGDVER